jgi:A/G-specific adenine glycosylase
MSDLGKKVISWYESQGRDLPWRETSSPYHIWIAETILQQTRIQQGIGYYYRFIERFPDVNTLAEASQDEVLKYWEGLGYYSRARNLHAASKQLVEEFGGEFPNHHDELIKLKGVGPYTSRAISSFAFGNETGVLDGNVMRVMSRLLSDASPINEQKTRKAWQQIIDGWVAGHDSQSFNHAMMDLGSTICTPKKPGCLICPLLENCAAYGEGTIDSLPQKKKIKRKTRYFQFALVYNENDEIGVQKRPEKGLWGGLYELPNREVTYDAWKKGEIPEGMNFHHELKHVFTHFDMMIKVYEGSSTNWELSSNIQFIPIEKISIFAFAKAVLKIFDRFGF